MNWLEIAKDLPMGTKTRINCECGDGKTLVVNHNTKYFSAHCFRCDFKHIEDKGIQSLADIAKIKELNEQALEIELELELPHDFSRDIPLHGRLWLYKAGISEPLWRQYGVGYSEHLGRVILPVYDTDGNLIWYQCRALLKGQKPKYIQPARDRSEVIFRSRDATPTGDAVVVEDILSAIRVGEVCTTYSLLGTKITTAQASVLGSHDTIATWLDPDKAGINGAKKIRRTLGLITEVGNIRSDDDPKCYSKKEIRRCIEQAGIKCKEVTHD